MAQLHASGLTTARPRMWCASEIDPIELASARVMQNLGFAKGPPGKTTSVALAGKFPVCNCTQARTATP